MPPVFELFKLTVEPATVPLDTTLTVPSALTTTVDPFGSEPEAIACKEFRVCHVGATPAPADTSA